MGDQRVGWPSWGELLGRGFEALGLFELTPEGGRTPAEHRPKGSAPDRTSLVVHICKGMLLSCRRELF